MDGVARNFDVRQVVIAGWTGRDREAVEHHVAELEAIGVRRPSDDPVFLPGRDDARSPPLPKIDVVGRESSGEAEFVLVSAADGIHVGIGSDHTDRKVETYGITVSKQMCPKPIGPELWRLADVEPHWDTLMIRSHVTRSGQPGALPGGTGDEDAGAARSPGKVSRFAGGPAARDGHVLRDAAGHGRDRGRETGSRSNCSIRSATSVCITTTASGASRSPIEQSRRG